jgi:hypothetical protein
MPSVGGTIEGPSFSSEEGSDVYALVRHVVNVSRMEDKSAIFASVVLVVVIVAMAWK